MTGRRMRRVLALAGTAVALGAALTGCAPGASGPTAVSTPPADSSAASSPSVDAAPSGAAVPRFAHVVVVVEENKAAGEVADRPFLAGLARTGATFTDFRAKTHPSEPNYLDLWSGSTHGVASDDCPIDLGGTPSLGSQLLAAGRTVAGYSEGLPGAGSAACTAGAYARKHNPLADFAATRGAAHNLPFSAFPTDYGRLPDVSLVVPDLNHDMHDGSVADGDRWLQQHLAGYARWAPAHDSLLVVTFDEDDRSDGNRIYTTLAGAHVRPGASAEPVTHDRLLHTIEASFGLAPLGAPAAPITDVWR